MTIRLHRKPGAGSLYVAVLCGVLGLGLGGCAGESDGDGDDGDDAEGVIGTPMSGPASDAPAQDPSPADEPRGEAADRGEGTPNVTGLDDGAAAGSDANAAEPDTETSSLAPASALDVPATEHCASVADWDPEWVQFEDEVLLLVNEFRSQPADCGVEGEFEPAAPLAMDPILRCSARLHSLDMYERDYFDHTNPDGLDPFQRMAEAGFVGGGGGENIAAGQSTPEEVMASWMESDGHCANIMRAAFTTIGIGYAPGDGGRGIGSNYWTQNFGAPPFMRGNRR